MSEIVLDRDAHVYTLNGRVLPGVTSILGSVTDYSAVPSLQLEFARQRGEDVHSAIELYHQGGLDYASLDTEVQPRLKQYFRFLDATNYLPQFAERIVHHSKLDYCGKLDLYGSFRDGSPALIDIKTGTVEAAAALQTAGYQAALADEFPQAAQARRYALWLRENEYRLIPFTDARDWSIFLSLLNIYKWTRSNGKRHYT